MRPAADNDDLTQPRLKHIHQPRKAPQIVFVDAFVRHY
jgi:hypothetical protein